MKEPLISQWSAWCNINYLILIFTLITTFHNANCFISSSTTTSSLLIAPSPSMFIKINYSDAITLSPNPLATARRNFFEKQEARSTTSSTHTPSSPSPSSSALFALYNNAPIRSRAIEQQQPYKVHYLMEQRKNNVKKVESATNKTEQPLTANQRVNKNAYFENVSQLLKNMQSKVLDANFSVNFKPVEPMKTLSQLSDQSEKLGFNDLLQAEESAYSENSVVKPSEYFISIPPQPTPIRIRFNTQTSMIETEQNHIKSPGVIKKMFTLEQPDQLIHMIHKPVVNNIKELISKPQRRRIQVIQKIDEHLQTKIINDFQDGNSNEPIYQEKPVEKVQHEISESNQQTNYEQNQPKLEVQYLQTTPVSQTAVMSTGSGFLKSQADAINPTEALSSDIELDKIIAKLIGQQDFANAQSEDAFSLNKAVLKNDQFSTNIHYSRPILSNSETGVHNSLRLSSIPTPQIDQFKFYQPQIKDLTTFFKPESEIQKRRMLSAAEMGFVPITTSSPAESFLPMGSQQRQSVLNIQTSQHIEQQAPDPEKMDGSDETAVNQSTEFLGSGISNVETGKMLNSGESKKVPDSTLEYVNTKRPPYEVNDGRQIVEGYLPPTFHEEVLYPGSALSEHQH